MSATKELGRITNAKFGYGGYQDAMLGLSISFGGDAWGCGDFKGAWGTTRHEGCQWTEEDRLHSLGEACMFLRDLLLKAKKQHVDELVGVPIEATFENLRLISWRVLEEVL